MSDEHALPEKPPSLFASLRLFRDFRLLWFGLLVSNLGTWMQFTALGYFVSSEAGSPGRAALDLGLIGLARAVPVLLCSPIAGVFADEYPRRFILLITNLAMSGVALALAILASTHLLTLPLVIALSVLNAAANSFDSPTRQSWVPLLVDRRYIGNAIGLNSVAFNAPAVIGPAIAGFTIVWVGVAGSFYLNAILTLAVVVAITLMKPSPPGLSRREPFSTAIREGVGFLASHAILKWIVLTFVMMAFLTRPYGQLTPSLCVNVFRTDAAGLGWAVAAVGAGGFGGALATAYFASRERKSLLWFVAGLVMSGGVFLLGTIHSLVPALPVLFLTGVGTLAYMGATNILIQTLSPDAVRGRAVSVFTMVALGFVPAGSFVVGSIASVIGLSGAFLIAGGTCFVAMVAVWTFKPVVRTV